jgi:haloalkane dehalogenase
MILEQNAFLEVNLRHTRLRRLTEEELAQYRRPFAEAGEARRPMLTWARQLPFDGELGDVAEIVTTYGAWIADNPIPKCIIPSDPGGMPPTAHCLSRLAHATRVQRAGAITPGGRPR